MDPTQDLKLETPYYAPGVKAANTILLACPKSTIGTDA